MIPLAFEYEVAESVDHAVELLGQHGEEAKLLAGGHSLLPIMKLRLAAPTVLVDLGRIDDLNYVRDEVLTEIRVPKLGGAGWSYKKFNRRAQDWAVVGVAAVVERSNGSIGSARIGLTNMGSTPLRATTAENAPP